MNSHFLDEENREEEYQSSCLNGVRTVITTEDCNNYVARVNTNCNNYAHHNVNYFDNYLISHFKLFYLSQAMYNKYNISYVQYKLT